MIQPFLPVYARKEDVHSLNYAEAEGDVSNSSDFLKYEMAVGMSSNARALTANLDALCASATWPGDGLKLLSYDPFI